MNTFKRKSLYAALAGVSALGATSAVQAVNVNPDGLGQVLLYPYFTVRSNAAGNAFQTLMSVVNTTASVKAVKVRFLEGKASQEVLDFNLYLSPNDVWTSAIIPTSDGAKLLTFDKSCTDPAIPSGGVDFVNYAYSSDPAGGSVDRVREGYFEIIEMGPVANTVLAAAATHNSSGVPANCAQVRNLDSSVLVNGVQSYVGTTCAGAVAVTGDIMTPCGGLFGSESLVNVNSGTDYTADPVPLDNWVQFPGTGQWFSPGSTSPNLTNVTPNTSTIFISGGATIDNETWQIQSIDAVSAALMHDNVYNEYTLDTGTASGTDWVVTFPTKRFYYAATANGNQGVTELFQRNFTSSGACDDIGVVVFDREEQFTVVNSFSPPLTQTFSICWEANVITFNNSNVLASVNKFNIGTIYQNGWMKLSFPIKNTATTSTIPPWIANLPQTAHQLLTSTAGAATYFGLPVIGFAVTSYTNGNIGGVLSNYGGNWIHKYTRSIGTLPP